MADQRRRPTDPKVGPADPETRRRMIEEQIAAARSESARRRQDEERRREEEQRRRREAATRRSPRDVPLGSGMASQAARAVGGHQRQIDRAVDEAVTGERRPLSEARRPKRTY